MTGPALPRRPYAAAVCLLLLAALWCPPASAHFGHRYDRIIIHLDHREEGIHAFVRLPMGLTVVNAKLQGLIPAEEFPFSERRLEDGRAMYYVAARRIAEDPEPLRQILAGVLDLSVNARRGSRGETLPAQVQALRIHGYEQLPAFDDLTSARSALRGPMLPAADEVTYVGDSVIDVQLFYPRRGYLETIRIAERISDVLASTYTVTVYVHYNRDRQHRLYNYGSIASPGLVLPASNSAWSAAWTFVPQGALHILAGLDHVLFVIVMLISATTLAQLAWRVTGFTLGHSVTLALGALELAPSGAWFMPTVETLIALSILVVAVLGLQTRTAGSHPLATGLVGLVHGYGFAFVLGDLLKPGSDQLLASLAAFNLGVEFGQLAIVIIAWPVLRALLASSNPLARGLPNLALLACAAIASYWVLDRGAGLIAALRSATG